MLFIVEFLNYHNVVELSLAFIRKQDAGYHKSY